MKAAILTSPASISERPLRIEQIPDPSIAAGQVLLRVRACGVCRTDLHIVEGELPPLGRKLIPGHQIVGEVVDGATPEVPVGTRVGVSWIGGIDGPAGIASVAWKTSAIRRLLLATPSTADMPSMLWPGPTLFFPSRRISMTCMPPRFCVRASSVSAACGLQEWSAENVWGCSGSGLRRISPSPCCAPGSAKFTFLPAAPLIGSLRNHWAQPGLERRATNRLSLWIAL